MIHHGLAVAKNDIGTLVKKDEEGIVTAYLPEDEKFAVWFSDDKWITFTGNENWFLEKFNYISNA